MVTISAAALGAMANVPAALHFIFSPKLPLTAALARWDGQIAFFASVGDQSALFCATQISLSVAKPSALALLSNCSRTSAGNVLLRESSHR